MRLSNISQFALLALTAWFALNFRAVDRLVSAEPLLSFAGLNLAALVVISIAALLRRAATAPLLLILLAIWAFLQIETHWRGYVLGASPERLAWYERIWGANWTILPPLPGHTVPDAYHTILFALILLTALSTLRDLLRGR